MTKSFRTALATFAVAATLTGGALASGGPGAAPAGGGSGFGTTVPSKALAGFVAKPLYREPSVAAGNSLNRVPCASASPSDTAVCYAAG